MRITIRDLHSPAGVISFFFTSFRSAFRYPGAQKFYSATVGVILLLMTGMTLPLDAGPSGTVADKDSEPTRLIVGLGYGGEGQLEIFGNSTGSYTYKNTIAVNWTEFNESGGRVYPAAGDLDGDGKSELVIGLSDAGNGFLEIKDDASTGYVHLGWIRVNWSGYRAAEGSVHPACGDVDGDGRDEIVVGLGNGGGGWVEIFDDASGGYNHLAWTRVRWASYNYANGATRPVCGDVDGDGRDEICLGLGAGSLGIFEVLDDGHTEFSHLAWLNIGWYDYQMSGGGTFPSTGDVDGDGKDELIVGLEEKGKGWMEAFDDAGANFSHLQWLRLDAKDYNRDHGLTRPTSGDLDNDGRAEIAVFLSDEGQGQFELLDDAGTGYEHLAWKQIHNETYRSRQVPWFWTSTGLSRMDTKGIPGAGQTIALIGTGVKSEIGAFGGNVLAGNDLLGANDSAAPDINGHDTSLAGLLVGDIEESRGPGIVPGATILPIRLTTVTGHTTAQLVADAIRKATDSGADIILIPMGNPQPCPAVGDAVSYARANGCILIASAGNGEGNKLHYPAARPGVIGVVAHNELNTIAANTNAALKADIAAPGVNLVTVSPFSTTDSELATGAEGSSAAAAVVAGIAARLRQIDPDLTQKELRALLKGGRERMQPRGYTRFFGYGTVNAMESARILKSGLGDVAIEDLRTVPADPKPGQPVTIEFLLRNRASSTSYAFDVEIVQHGVGSIRSQLSGDSLTDLVLDPGEERNVTVRWNNTPSDPFWIGAGAMYGYYEFNGINNVKWVKVNPSPDPSRFVDTTGFQYDQSSSTGNRIDFTWTFQNKGNVPEPSISLTGNIGEETVLQKTGITLAPGESRTVDLTWSGDLGRYENRVLELRASPNGIVDGADEPYDDLVRFRFLHLPDNKIYKINYVDTAGQDMIVDVPWRLAPDRDFLPFLFFVGSIQWKYAYPSYFYLFGSGNRADLSLTKSTASLKEAPYELFRSSSGGANISLNYDINSLTILDPMGDPTDDLMPAYEPHLSNNQWPVRKGFNNGYHRVLRIDRNIVDQLKSRDQSLWLRADVFRYDLPAIKALSFQEAYQRTSQFPPSADRYIEARRYRRVVLNKINRSGSAFILPRQHRQMFHVYVANENFPMPADSAGAKYFDGHFHSIAEWSTNDFRKAAPRKQHGGPLVMLIESSRAIGIINKAEQPSGELISMGNINQRNRVISTDHNVFFSDRESPEVGPTKDTEELEYLQMRRHPRGLGLTAGQEITLRKEISGTLKEKVKKGAVNMGAHLLAYNLYRVPGVFHGGMHLAGYDLFGHNPNNVLRVLSGKRRVEDHEHPLQGTRSSFAAHPWHPGLSWTQDMLDRATGTKFLDDQDMLSKTVQEEDSETGASYSFQYPDLIGLDPDLNPTFSGVQVWNGRRAGSSLSIPEKGFTNLDPWGVQDAKFQTDPRMPSNYAGLRSNLVRWFDLIEKTLRVGVSAGELGRGYEGNIWTIRKLYGMGGTDAHGDFNYTRNLSTFSYPFTLDLKLELGWKAKILTTHNPIWGPYLYVNYKYLQNHWKRNTNIRDLMKKAGAEFKASVDSNAHGRVRTLAFNEDRGLSQNPQFDSLMHGRSIMTDRIVFHPYVDAQRKWDSENFEFNDRLGIDDRGFIHKEGKMGGAGYHGGKRTVLIPVYNSMFGEDSAGGHMNYVPEPTIHTDYKSYFWMMEHPHFEVHSIFGKTIFEHDDSKRRAVRTKVLDKGNTHKYWDYLETPAFYTVKTMAHVPIIVHGESDNGEQFLDVDKKEDAEKVLFSTAKTVAVGNPIYGAWCGYHFLERKLEPDGEGQLKLTAVGRLFSPISLKADEDENGNGRIDPGERLAGGFKQIGSDGRTMGNEQLAIFTIAKENPNILTFVIEVELDEENPYSITTHESKDIANFSGVIYLKEKPKDAWKNSLNRIALPVEIFPDKEEAEAK